MAPRALRRAALLSEWGSAAAWGYTTGLSNPLVMCHLYLCRYNLPVCIVVMNNGEGGGGLETLLHQTAGEFVQRDSLHAALLGAAPQPVCYNECPCLL